MNRLLFVFGLSFILIMPQAFAITTKSPYPNPNRQTAWNNFTDGIHTLGQTPQQAEYNKRKLHNARTRNRLRSINKDKAAKFKAKRQAWLKSQQQQ